jgi:hypothetical protein
MNLARITQLDPGEKRSEHRSDVGMASTARGADNAAVDVEVLDMSSSGLAFISATNWAIGSRISVGLAGPGRVSGAIVRRRGNLYGCSFDRQLTLEEVAHSFPQGRSPVLNLGVEPLSSTPEYILSIRARFLTIVGLSLALWAAILAFLLL